MLVFVVELATSPTDAPAFRGGGKPKIDYREVLSDTGATGHPHDKSSRKTANVILKERAPTRSVGRRLKDLPMTQHNEQAKTSEVIAMYEYYRLCISDSLADSSVADQRCASVPAPSE